MIITPRASGVAVGRRSMRPACLPVFQEAPRRFSVHKSCLTLLCSFFPVLFSRTFFRFGLLFLLFLSVSFMTPVFSSSWLRHGDWVIRLHRQNYLRRAILTQM